MRPRLPHLLAPLIGLAFLLSPAQALSAPGDPVVVDADADAKKADGTEGTFFSGVDRVLAGGSFERLTGVNALPDATALAFTGPHTLVTVGRQALGLLDLSDGRLVTVPATAAGELKGVALAPDGSLIATDGGAKSDNTADGRVLRISPAGAVLETIASGEDLQNPVGVAVAEDGTIYVTDVDGNGAGQIVRIDASSPHAQSIVASTPFVSPWGIAFLPSGRLVVADSAYGHAFRGALVQVDPETGAQTARFLERLNGEIDNATGVAVQADGEVLVSERNSGQIDRVDLASGAAEQVGHGMFTPVDLETEPGIAPTTALLSGPTGTTRDTTPTFSFAPSQYGAQSTCQVAGEPPVPCRRTFTSPDLTPGAYTFSVSSTMLGAEGPTVTRGFSVDPSAPDTLIDSGPSGPTNDSTPTFSFEAPGGGGSFTCSIDGGLGGGCQSPLTVEPALVDGFHTFTVRAEGDPSGDTRGFTVDTVAPQTSISSGPAEGASTGQTQPTFTFASSEDPSTFACTLDAVAVPCASVFTPAAPLGEGAHTLTVAATDAAGNTDPAPLSRHFTVDTTPPQTTIVEGPSGTTDVAAPTFRFLASEPGASFRCSIDSLTLTACTSPFTVAPALLDGEHTFRVRAIDAAGNVETAVQQRDFTVDTVAPDTSITAGPSGPTNVAAPSFEFQSTKPGSTFACEIDGAAPVACLSPFPLAALGEGTHTFSVVATDGLGHVDPTAATRAFSVDLTPPLTALGAGPGPLTKDRTPVFHFSSEPGATFSCRIDAGAAAPCTSPFTAPPLSDDTHTLRVTATDPAGNAEAAPPAFTFTVDTTAPQTSIDSGPSGDTTQRRPTFAFSAGENASFGCSLDGAPPLDCDRTFQPGADLAFGTHTLTVTATDAAGNPDPSPAQRSFRVVPEIPEEPKLPPPKPPAPEETHPGPAQADLHLSATLRNHTLRIHTTVSAGATGSLAVTVTGHGGKARLRRRIAVTLRAGRGSANLRVSAAIRRLGVLARYEGDRNYAPASRAVTVTASAPSG